MAKLTLSDLTSLTNEVSAVATINNNSAAIETALENTLSRDGTSPNAMGADLDMNSNSILNLPEATAPTEPVRKQEFDALETVLSALADEAEGYKDDAETAAAAAATSAGNAATSASNTAAIYDSFDDRYLGSKAVEPTLDNDGDALIEGALYWDSVIKRLYIYTGSAWQAATDFLNSNLTSWSSITRASGFDTFTATPSSANLKSLITDETGSGALVFATSPTLVTPALGTPASGTLTNCTGLPTTGLVDDAVTNAKLANVATNTIKGRITASTGDPEDLTVTQVTAMLNTMQGDSGSGGLKGLVPAQVAGDATKFLRGDGTFQSIPGGGDALTANPLSQFAATTSAQLAGVISDETGTGALVFATSPTLVTPALGTPASGNLANCTFSVEAKRLATSSPALGNGFAINAGVTASVAANALTVNLVDAAGSTPSANSPVLIPFRSATAATGTIDWISITGATSLVLSSGSTIGTTNSTPFSLWLVAFNDAGTVRLGLINCLSTLDIYPLGAYPIASSTAEGGAGAADAAHTFYTGTAVTTKSYTIIARLSWESGLGTVGTWSAGPTRIELTGSHTVLPGKAVQKVIARSATGANGTTVIPTDNTTPQNTEGVEFITKAITPVSASNLLNVVNKGHYAGSNSDSYLTVALFKDSAADAIATALVAKANTAQGSALGLLRHTLLASSSSSQTFKIRAGSGGAGTFYFNSTSGGSYFNGTLDSYLEIEEIAV